MSNEAPQPAPLVVGITGHRPDKLGGWRWCPTHAKVINDLRRAIIHLRPGYIITGMALGVDQWAAEIAIELGVPFIAAVPFDGQEGTWPPAAQNKYRQILSNAYRIYTVSPGPYEAWKMAERNKWVVANCHKLLAVWDGSRDGGTSHCVDYAERVGREIFRINPHEPLVISGEVPVNGPNPNAMVPINRTPQMSQTAAELIARTRAATPQQRPSPNFQNLPGPARRAPMPNAQQEQPAAPNPYRRVLDID